MFFDETKKMLCLVPWQNLQPVPVSQHPPRKSAYTVPYRTVPYRTAPYGTVPYGIVGLKLDGCESQKNVQFFGCGTESQGGTYWVRKYAARELRFSVVTVPVTRIVVSLTTTEPFTLCGSFSFAQTELVSSSTLRSSILGVFYFVFLYFVMLLSQIIIYIYNLS
jgi:hypothetical protein